MQDRSERVGGGPEEALEFVALGERERREPVDAVGVVELTGEAVQPFAGGARGTSRSGHVAQDHDAVLVAAFHRRSLLDRNVTVNG